MRIALAEDSVLLRDGLVRLLTASGHEVTAQVGTADDLVAAVAELQPDVVVTDIRMPPTHTDEGLRAAEQIRQTAPQVGVLVLSQYVEPRYAQELLHAREGGAGYLLKDRITEVDEFLDAVERVAAGGSVIDREVVAQLMGKYAVRSRLAALSERERAVLELMAQGRSNAAVSERLSLSPKTVETHIGSIFSKLGLAPAAGDHRRVLAVLELLRA
jgi:DNA-binding NarL/FixJ family response regulator